MGSMINSELVLIAKIISANRHVSARFPVYFKRKILWKSAALRKNLATRFKLKKLNNAGNFEVSPRPSATTEKAPANPKANARVLSKPQKSPRMPDKKLCQVLCKNAQNYPLNLVIV